MYMYVYDYRITNLLPSRFMKCGYCRLKCRSNSVSSNGVPFETPPIFPPPLLVAPPPPAPIPPPTVFVVDDVIIPPPDPGAIDDNIDWGTGISCDRNVRLELCILTANDNDDKSDGNGVRSDRRVIVNEHSL